MVWSVAVMYTRRGWRVSSLWRIGGEVRVVLCFWKICSQSSVHVNRVDFFRSWTMGWVCSASLGRKQEMAVRWPMRRWTSLMVVGLRISIMTLHFSGLASMPRWVNINPRNLPRSTPNTYLSGLRRRLYWRSAEKTAERSSACWWWLGDLTTISSTYTLT